MVLARKSVVEAVYCLRCGGPADEESRRKQSCGYCRAPLVPLDHPDPRKSAPCRQCAAPIVHSSRYCGQCGHPARQGESPAITSHPCPGCGHSSMHEWTLDDPERADSIALCGECGGSFVSHRCLDHLIDREDARFERNLGGAEPRLDEVQRFTIATSEGSLERRDCPICDRRMARRNYARLSGVILDHCHLHGVYFDAGELAQVLAFVRSGGLAVDKARRTKAKRKEQRERNEYLPTRMDARIELGHHSLRRSQWGVLDLLEVGGFLWRMLRRLFRHFDDSS